MKVTIEINEADAEILARWASVSRTLNTAKKMCERVCGDNRIMYDAEVCLEELEILEPQLNRLHQSVRNELWKRNQNEST